MKKQYTAPQVTAYGNVEAITKAFGDSPEADSIILGGVVQPPSDGSGDIVFP